MQDQKQLLTPVDVESVAKSTKADKLIEESLARSAKASVVANTLLSKDMDTELMVTCEKFVLSCKSAEKELKEKRLPLTRKMDEIKKKFTTSERSIIAAIDRVTRAMNIYATEQERKRIAEERAIREAAEVDTRILEHFNSYLVTFKEGMRQALDTITLENYYDKKNTIESKKFIYSRKHFAKFEPKQPEEKYDELNALFVAHINEYRMQILGFLPAIKEELKKKKEVKIFDKIEAPKGVEKKIEEKKVEELTNLMNVEETGLNSKKYYEIQLVDNDALIQIFNFWFLKQGQDMDLSKVGTMTIDRMVKYAEKMATKENEFIETKSIKYDEKFKV